MIRQNSLSNGAHLLGEDCQGFSLSVIPDLCQQEMSEWLTWSTLFESSSMQVQNTLSSQQSPQVWKSSARVPLVWVQNSWVLQNWFLEGQGPQCKVDTNISGPPPTDCGYPTFPLLSRMSISPLAGQVPYWLYLGIIQMAGQSQSPMGSFARTSTLPYLKENELTVVSLALMTGLMQFTPSDVREQPLLKLAVQYSAGLLPQNSQVQPFLTLLLPILSSVSTGRMLRVELLTQEVDRLFSQIWNSLFPPPAMVMSCFHFFMSSSSKSSLKTSFENDCETRHNIKMSKRYFIFKQCIQFFAYNLDAKYLFEKLLRISIINEWQNYVHFFVFTFFLHTLSLQTFQINPSHYIKHVKQRQGTRRPFRPVQALRKLLEKVSGIQFINMKSYFRINCTDESMKSKISEHFHTEFKVDVTDVVEKFLELKKEEKEKRRPRNPRAPQ